jgi:hypothetical protein
VAKPKKQRRCERCSNYLAICGHDLTLKKRLKAVQIDTSWMPNAGSHGRTDN